VAKLVARLLATTAIWVRIHKRRHELGQQTLHRKKKVREFPVPSRDVTTKLSLGGNNDVITELFLPRGSLVSDIPAGDGKLVNLFLQCSLPKKRVFLLTSDAVYLKGCSTIYIHSHMFRFNCRQQTHTKICF
jgi:hypothetical protein